MKNPDIVAIRKRLAHGDLTKIADSIGVSSKIVSEFFAYGWHRQHTGRILARAADLIQDQSPDEDVNAIFEDEGLTSHGAFFPKKKRKNQDNPGRNPGFSPWMILFAIPLVLYFILPGFKAWVNSLLSRFTSGAGDKLTEAQKDYMRLHTKTG